MKVLVTILSLVLGFSATAVSVQSPSKVKKSSIVKNHSPGKDRVSVLNVLIVYPTLTKSPKEHK